MQVKDVEKLTGLSTKAIRLYEEKGLIEVARNPLNDYRDYSEENVRQLRLIKLLRYFEFSLAEITALLALPEEDLQSALREKKRGINQQAEELTEKVDLLDQVVRDLGKKEDWLEEAQESIAFVESGEFQDFKQDLENALLPSIWMTLLQTLMASGPILWLFTRIQQGRQENLFLLTVFSLLATVWITLLWRDYLVTWWKHRDKVRQKNRSQAWWIPIGLISLVGGLAYFVLVGWLTERFFLPSDWLFYEYSTGLGKVTIFFIMAFLVFLLGKLARLVKLSWKYGLGLAGGCIMLTALLISTTTAVTKDQIIDINLLAPSKAYLYSDVKSVWTGFGTKLVTVNRAERQGEFSYQIQLDGKNIVFMQPTVNQNLIPDDTYIELEEFDRQLMNLKIPKESSTEGSQYNELDSHYLKRFLRIVENK
ncbi:TPA: MerR family transcriptional regulator [Streptococcus suis]|uniref:MerR family transcriptional regulator n=1 Tax=Streptococcus suis TaxID=1307 RepID=UPI00195F408C|nr:MerR family transcriptional regulator [Streptococcus suis]MBM7154284.1 MerR family transcriptional regulator [Streptococcus suis]MDG4504081.1 MerR family transcriptional regulator [Streptococcus suis]MDW8710567.1 MerR family transcriptional regulator [Streptococcus suis]HEL1634692.1 MerR family transcriptional regulator [Streptococcus suis]HEM5006239.1 MerR family transcriptional regulator [Streptococcus suis]